MLHLPPSRRDLLLLSAAGLGTLALPRWAFAAEGLPTHDPAAALKLPWTGRFKWNNVVDVTKFPGDDWLAKLNAAQAAVVAKDGAGTGGGVVFFPAGTYEFKDHVKLKDGIVLRGAEPKVVSLAQNDRYDPPTKFEFPKYKPLLEGDGTPIDTAFKGVYLDNPTGGQFTGLVHIAINRGHIHLGEGENHACKGHRIVFGCVLRNAAVADENIPKLATGQHKWQRFTKRHHAAIDVVGENVLIANNRLPRSGEDNFAMKGYVLSLGKGQTQAFDDVVFDYDNRPGLYINHYCVGGSGGSGDDGTPQSHPFGFRKGTVIRDNYIYNSGRMAIGFCGDGALCASNIIRIARDVWRPTATGEAMTRGSSTNDNRAIEMRGWRWVVDGNDYEVHRNWAADRKYLINDGEGLMHEDHCNSTIQDSRLTNNRGNAYLSIYKCGPIDGLLVEGNDINVARGTAIMVVADRNSGRQPISNVTIANNKTRGGGIAVGGEPAKNVVVKNNKHSGTGGKIDNRAAAKLEGNEGYNA
ncbi:MAG: hypothetical protein WD768_11745 [Phycisphaeraceae bacterium]